MEKILIIGAAAYQVPAIVRAKELGHTVYCVDYKEGQPGFVYADGYKIIDVRDKEHCLEYAKELGIDGVLTWGATLTLPTVAYISENMGLPGISEETAELSMSKFLIKKKLVVCGLNTGGEVFQLRDWNEAKTHQYNFPVVIKPSDGSGSKGVSIVKGESELNEAIQYAFDGARNHEIYVEPFIQGTEYSVEAYVNTGKVYIYSIVKTSFRWMGDYPLYTQTTYLDLDEDTENKIGVEVEKAIHALDVQWGPVNFDVIVSAEDGKPYIIDVGIRNGQNLIASHIVPLSRGVDELNNSIRICLGQDIDAKPLKKEYISSRLLIYKPGEIVDIKPYDNLIGQNQIVDIILRKTVGDKLPHYQTKSDICGWVLTKGSTPEEALLYGNEAWKLLENYIIINHV